ncbi:carbohydrate ABC transporter permease [Salinispira pacifica]
MMNRRSVPASTVAYLGAILVAVVMIFPFLWMLASSFKTTHDMFNNTLALIPENPTLSAYKSVKTLAGIPFGRYLFNSLFIVSFSVALTVVVTSLGAYALHRKPHLPLFPLLHNLFLVSIMYPYILLMIPVYVVMFKLGLLGTYTGIIVFLALGPVQFFLFKEFFAKIPGEIIESAQVDGAGEWRIYRGIVVPMARPVFVTVILLSFILNWDNWFPVLVISTKMTTYTLPVSLFILDSQLGVNFPEIMALACIVSVPIILLFVFTQRYVIEGFAAGSVKG